MATDRYLFISDLQIPFEAEKALKFCKALQKEFSISPLNIYCVGDEVDQYFASRFPRDPDAPMSTLHEIREAKDRLRDWYRAFPRMKLATSNHGMRWAKRAFDAQIPSVMIRAYQEVLGAPAGWEWKDEWLIGAKHAPIKMFHGMGYGGMYAYRTAAMDHGMNVVFGHLHANAGVAHVKTASKKCWGMNVGSLIDCSSYAFHYGKDNRFKPWLGAGVVLDGGLTPLLIPYERFR